jgi:CRISPR type IV-associated protein Csf1
MRELEMQESVGENLSPSHAHRNLNATRLLYHAAGSPPVEGTESAQGLCWLCGAELSGQGVPRDQVLKDSFMDLDKCASPLSPHLCPPCAWSFSERVVLPGRDKPQRLRNYSHFVVQGRWFCLSKGQKREMQQILLHPPEGEWLAVLSVSGQKHLIFRAPVSVGAHVCAVQFEEQRLTYAPAALDSVLTTIQSLLALGFSKTEIETGQYSAARFLKAGLAAWQNLESQLRAPRGAPLFLLALFLAQKEQGDE